MNALSKLAPLSLLLSCGQLTGAILIDDFSSTSLPLILTDSTADSSFVTSGFDSAPGTLFDRRYASAYLDSGPGSVDARITGGVARLTTTSGATGRFYLYHDSNFMGPYLDMTGEYAADGGIMLSFANATSGSIAVTLAIQSVGGRLLGNFGIPTGVSEVFFPFSSFSKDGNFDPATVYENRTFFTNIGPGTTLDIDSISIVPETSTTFLCALSAAALLRRKRNAR